MDNLLNDKELCEFIGSTPIGIITLNTLGQKERVNYFHRQISMKFTIFHCCPSLNPAGPVKGAIALANQLVIDNEVLLVSLKPGSGASTHIDPK